MLPQSSSLGSKALTVTVKSLAAHLYASNPTLTHAMAESYGLTDFQNRRQSIPQTFCFKYRGIGEKEY